MQQGCIGDVEGSGGRRRSRRLTAALTAAVAATALLAATAQASFVTVGSVLPPGSTPTAFGEVRTLFNTALPEAGASLASPVNGAIVRWRAQGLKGGPFHLRILRPNGKGAYEAVGTSAPASPSGVDLQTFTTNLSVRTGDLIGIDPTAAADEIGVSEATGASFGYIFPPPFNGSIVPPSGSEAGKEIQLSAEIQPAPAVTDVTPGSGSIKGGTEVIIAGTNLNGTSSVRFGTKTATSVAVDSDTQITATAPATAKPGRVDITVTTLAGTSQEVRADGFTYTACVVPKLTGKKLGVVKNRLRAAGCKLGRVKKVSDQKGKVGSVVKQTPKAGKILAPGSKVSVNVIEK